MTVLDLVVCPSRQHCGPFALSQHRGGCRVPCVCDAANIGDGPVGAVPFLPVHQGPEQMAQVLERIWHDHGRGGAAEKPRTLVSAAGSRALHVGGRHDPFNNDTARGWTCQMISPQRLSFAGCRTIMPSRWPFCSGCSCPALRYACGICGCMGGGQRLYFAIRPCQGHAGRYEILSCIYCTNKMP